MKNHRQIESTKKGLNKVFNNFVCELTKSRHFFEKNVTGYTYLFFAQTSFIAENAVWKYQLNGPYRKVRVHSFTGVSLTIEILVYYALPLLFILAAFLTFKYPKSKWDTFTFVVTTIALSMFILIYSFL